MRRWRPPSPASLNRHAPHAMDSPRGPGFPARGRSVNRYAGHHTHDVRAVDTGGKARPHRPFREPDLTGNPNRERPPALRFSLDRRKPWMSNVTTVEPGGAPEIEVGAPPGNHFGLERDRRGCAAGRISDGTTVRLPSDLPSRGGLGLIGGQRVQSRDARLAC